MASGLQFIQRQIAAADVQIIRHVAEHAWIITGPRCSAAKVTSGAIDQDVGNRPLNSGLEAVAGADRLGVASDGAACYATIRGVPR